MDKKEGEFTVKVNWIYVKSGELSVDEVKCDTFLKTISEVAYLCKLFFDKGKLSNICFPFHIQSIQISNKKFGNILTVAEEKVSFNLKNNNIPIVRKFMGLFSEGIDIPLPEFISKAMLGNSNNRMINISSIGKWREKKK